MSNTIFKFEVGDEVIVNEPKSIFKDFKAVVTAQLDAYAPAYDIEIMYGTQSRKTSIYEKHLLRAKINNWRKQL